MLNLEKLQQLQLWLEDNVDQGHTALVYENADGVTLTQADCAQALDDVLGINDGIDLYAKTIANLTLEMAKLSLSSEANKATVLRNMARAVAKITEQMYQRLTFLKEPSPHWWWLIANCGNCYHNPQHRNTSCNASSF